MDSSLFIGTKVDKNTADNMGGFVETVFKAGKDNNMEQATIVEALNIIAKAVSPKNVQVSHCEFLGEKIINLKD